MASFCGVCQIGLLLAGLLLVLATVPAKAGEFPTKAQVDEAAKLSLKEMAVYKSPQHKFTIKYPQNWDKLEPKDSPIVCKFLIMGGLASYRVAVESLPAGTTLADYFKVTNEQVKQAMAAQKMPITVVSESDSKLAGQPAKKSVYTFTFEDSPRTPKGEQYLVVKGDKGYVFNYTADSEVFDSFHTVIDRALDSMEFE
ncbi:MAG: hypothetical protein Q8T09_18635 [Candidatus Melainabacteria bacterium]|nr:hypothetical protein [Candidatus Melainabacteria bacterium]